MADERDARLILRAEDRATKTFKEVGASLDALTKRVADQSKALAVGEGSIEDYKKTLKELEQVGKDLVSQQGAITSFERTGDAAAAAAVKLTEAQKAYEAYSNGLAAKGKLDDPPKRLQTLANAVERLTAASDKAGARYESARLKLTALGLSADDTAGQFSLINDRAEQTARAIAQATLSVDGFATAQERAARAGAEGARNTSVGKIADDAIKASTNLNRFAQTTDVTTQGLTNLARTIQSIVSPTLAEIQTLAGALDQVEASAALAGDKQKQRASVYQDSLNQLKGAQAAFVRQAQNIQAFTQQDVAVRALEADLAQASVRTEQLAKAFRQTGTAELERELAQASAQLEKVGVQTLNERKVLEQMSIALKRAGVDTNNLASELVRLEAGARRSAVVADTLTTKVGGNGKGFLGLKSYELTNLGYQINDVFTSLASGISPVQTLAQQGPQIAQLFPSILLGALKLLPILAPIGAAFGLIAYNIYETKKATDAIKGFDTLFTLSGNAAGLSADQFGRAQIALQDLGVSADDAKTVLRTFIADGLDPSGLTKFGEEAKTLADIVGISVPEAATKLADAFSGGYDQVAALNDITGVYTQAQLDEIRALFDAGKAQDARTLAAKIYGDKQDEIAGKAKGEWAQATDRLGQAFSNLNTQFGLAQGSSNLAIVGINLLAREVRGLTAIVNGAVAAFRLLALVSTGVDPGGTSARAPTSDEQARIDRANAKYGTGGKAAVTPGKPPRTKEQQDFIDGQQTELKGAKLLTAQERLRTAEVDARRKAESVGLKDAEVEQAGLNARKIEQDKLDKEAASRAKSAASAARSSESKAAAAAREAEARQNRINGLTKDLENVYTSLETNKADDPFGAIQKKAEIAIRNIKAKFADLAKLGVTQVDGRGLADYEAAVRAAAALETSQARQKQNEEDVNKLLELRKIRLGEIEDTVTNPADRIAASQKVVDDLNPKIAAAAQSALTFAQALRTAEPDPKLEAFIAKLQATLTEASGNKTQIKIGLDNLKDAQTQLDALVQRRDELVKVQNALVEAGAQTTSGAQTAIKAAYEASQPAILAQADAVQAIIDKLLLLPGISDEVRARLMTIAASIPVVRAQTTLLDADIVSLKESTTQALAGGIGTFIESLGDSLARALDGTDSLSKALGNIAQAALAFAANFVKAIAQAIVQLVALKIAKAAVNAIGFHTGGVVGSGGTFTRSVNPLTFAGAIRYHSGGLVGLRPDEVPAILQKGEEVITANDPRHRANGGGGPSAPPVMLKNINLFDAGEAVSQGANTRAGEQAILNVIQRNPGAVRAAVGQD